MYHERVAVLAEYGEECFQLGRIIMTLLGDNTGVRSPSHTDCRRLQLSRNLICRAIDGEE